MTSIDREYHPAIPADSRKAVFADILRGLHERSPRFWLFRCPGCIISNTCTRNASNCSGCGASATPKARRSVQKHIEAFRATTLFNRIRAGSVG